MDDALCLSPLPASAGSPGHPRSVADAPAEPGTGEPRVLLVDRSTNTAVVLLDGVSHVLGIDYDSADGSIGPAWWRTTPEVDAALGLVGDDLLCELLSDAYNEQLRAEWA